MKRERVLEFTRYNSGRHFLDSGGAYGRIHESPPPPEGQLIIPGEYPSISVTEMLVQFAEEDTETMALLDQHAEDNPEDSWFEIGQGCMENAGFVCVSRDNIYNHENDFDQVWIYEIWTQEGFNGDWIYADPEDAVVILYLHTGCDVRGGYSPPLAVRFDGISDYILPLDWVCQYYCEGAPDEENERYLCGYSSNPRCEVEDAGYEFDRIEGDHMVFTKDGAEFKFHADAPYWG